MSKTLGSILTVAASIAVNVLLPGSGMLLTAVRSAATAAGLSAFTSLAGSVIFGTPSRPPDTTESSRKTPVPPRTRAYGQLRLYGGWIGEA